MERGLPFVRTMPARFLLMLVSCVWALAFTSRASAQRPDFRIARPEKAPPKVDNDVVPSGYHLEERPRGGKTTAAALFLMAYAVDVGLGLSIKSCRSTEQRECAADELALFYFTPVVGPTFLGGLWLREEPTSWMAWATLGTGAVQTVGAGLWLTKTLMGPERVLVQDETVPSAVIAPTTLGPRSAGLSISGAF